MIIIESATEIELFWKLTGVIESYEEVKVKTPSDMVIDKIILKVVRCDIREDFYISKSDEEVLNCINKNVCLLITNARVAGLRKVIKINHLDAASQNLAKF